MASNLVVISSTAHRAVIKTTPGKFLSDVLEEACAKLGLDASLHGLKNNNKPLDLSRTVRLAGLSSGAKVELVQISRSPSVVSVALQVPESEARGAPNNRLTDKFPSNTTLWLLLRKFESGKVGGDGLQRNFTARGVPKPWNGDSGAGRLYYEQPVLNVAGRELSSFTDLQKTLAQLGFNGGTALIRLGFRLMTTPLEEAMEQIGQYFQGEELERSQTVENRATVDTIAPSVTPESTVSAPHEIENETASEPLKPGENVKPPIIDYTESTLAANGELPPMEPTENSSALATSSIASLKSIPGQSTISVYAPPSSTVPQAAQKVHRESDYEPTIAHAKLHQSRLATTGQNKRLPTHAEEAAQKEEQARKLAGIREVTIRVRFPDQMQVSRVFSSESAAADLYAFVKSVMLHENEPFTLIFSSGKGPLPVPKNGIQRLIAQLGMTGRILVTLNWDEAASSQARLAASMKPEIAAQAKELVPPVIRDEDVEEEKVDAGTTKGKEKEGGRTKSSGGAPKWLKHLGGKK
ncbi:hypothetical protein MMC26_001374 [Xylographa opegraphella]|nr:hypothetical protein [Xylographa opegraphella]